MNLIRPEWPHRGESRNDVERSVEIEDEMQKIIRRDVVAMRQLQNGAAKDGSEDRISMLVQSVCDNSVTAIENLIAELQLRRDFLQSEGRRVQREIAGYAELSRTAMDAIEVIGENLPLWDTAIGSRRADPDDRAM